MRDKFNFGPRLLAFLITVALWLFLAKFPLIALFVFLHQHAHFSVGREGFVAAYFVTFLVGAFVIFRALFSVSVK